MFDIDTALTHINIELCPAFHVVSGVCVHALQVYMLHGVEVLLNGAWNQQQEMFVFYWSWMIM
jgi:hypothetical protein